MNNLSARNGIIIAATILIILIIGLSIAQNAKHKSSSTTVQPSVNYIIPTNNDNIKSLFVTSTNPKDKATDIPINTQIKVTFNRSISNNQIKVLISPAIDFTQSVNHDTLIITPNKDLSTGTEYIYIIKSTELDTNTVPYRFTTAGTKTSSEAAYPPPGFFQLRDKVTLDERPDIYVKNHMPFSNQYFSIDSAFVQQPQPPHFAFTVSLLNNADQSKQEFIKWLQSLGLSDKQINTLDITYK